MNKHPVGHIFYQFIGCFNGIDFACTIFHWCRLAVCLFFIRSFFSRSNESSCLNQIKCIETCLWKSNRKNANSKEKLKWKTHSNEFSIKCGKCIINSLFRNSQLKLYSMHFNCIWWLNRGRMHKTHCWKIASPTRVLFGNTVFLPSSMYLPCCLDWIDNSMHKYLLNFHMPEQQRWLWLKCMNCASRPKRQAPNKFGLNSFFFCNFGWALRLNTATHGMLFISPPLCLCASLSLGACESVLIEYAINSTINALYGTA